MANITIKGHATRGDEVRELLVMLGAKNQYKGTFKGTFKGFYYWIEDEQVTSSHVPPENSIIIFSLEEFLEKYPYKVGDNVTHYVGRLLETHVITNMRWDSDNNCVLYYLDNCDIIKVEDILYKIGCPEDNIPTIQDKTTIETMKEDKGNISDGYHTFNELYEYRLLYNASMFNELAKQNLYDVHKSKFHSDGTIPFGDENWFIVQAELPTGQISNHYEMKDWDLFQVPIKEKANPYDGHTPQDVAKRLREFLTPKPQYPKTYEECCEILDIYSSREIQPSFFADISEIEKDLSYKLSLLYKLYICRNAYWKIAGEEMGLDKPWKPDWNNQNDCYHAIKTCKNEVCLVSTLYIEDCILAFPTEEIRNTFYENFKDLIEQCKELL